MIEPLETSESILIENKVIVIQRKSRIELLKASETILIENKVSVIHSDGRKEVIGMQRKENRAFKRNPISFDLSTR